MTPYARLSEDRLTVLCGRQYPTGHFCNEVLAHVIADGLDGEGPRYLTWEYDWHPYPNPPLKATEIRRTGQERARRGYPATRRGDPKARPTLGSDRPRRPMKALGFELPAKCRACKLVNVLDPVRLDVRKMPKG